MASRWLILKWYLCWCCLSFFPSRSIAVGRVESEGYAALEALGATKLRRVDTAGGGAVNPTWTAMRQRMLGVPTGASLPLSSLPLVCSDVVRCLLFCQDEHRGWFLKPRVVRVVRVY